MQSPLYRSSATIPSVNWMSYFSQKIKARKHELPHLFTTESRQPCMSPSPFFLWLQGGRKYQSIPSPGTGQSSTGALEPINGWLNNAFQVLIPGTSECGLIGQSRLCSCDSIKDLDVGRLCWNIWVGSKCNHKWP